jgi:predicted secreted acid phosphatase
MRGRSRVLSLTVWFRAAWILPLALALAGCATRTQEPPNLDLHKQQIRAYVDSGRYEREIAAVAAQAKAWVEQRSAARRAGERLAIVFDLDETLFFNLHHIRAQDFGYVPAVWEAWVQSASAPPIEPVREVYRTARRLGLEIFFITGRPEEHRAPTERNLVAIGCGEYTRLICKPAGHRGTSAEYKIAARHALAGEGHTIIANLGDQRSDLAGGHSERSFKLPAPFYLTE